MLQGLALPLLIRALRLEEDTQDADEELEARLETAFAAIDRIEQLAEEDWPHEDTIDRVRQLYDYRRRRFSSRIDGHDSRGRLRLRGARRALLARHVRGDRRPARRAARDCATRASITDEVRRTVEHDLDLEEARLDRNSAGS